MEKSHQYGKINNNFYFGGIFISVAGTYILYYTIVFSTALLTHISEVMRCNKMKKIGKLVFWSAVILPVIIAGNRYGIGTDYFNYENIYRNLNNSYGGIFYLLENTRYEPGWISLNLLVEFLFGDIVYLFIISSLLTWVFFFKAIYNHKDKVSVGISILILFCTTYNSS